MQTIVTAESAQPRGMSGCSVGVSGMDAMIISGTDI